ncbi:MAG: RNA-binding transcriptional accessory protein [Desulfobacterales bacterium]|nr:RNA-binding transcriptional accessory protein [Desulfobacterales bacterium]
MNEKHIDIIAEELSLKIRQVTAVAELLSEGSTIPFIARYRKEATGSLDEVVIASIRDKLHYLKEFDDRRETILKSLEQHGHLTDELKEKVLAAKTIPELEDIYLPYKPKRKTRASVAREKGLEPLALLLLEQNGIDIIKTAESFIDEEKGVDSSEKALSYARDIIAEIVNEDQTARSKVRNLFATQGIITSKVIAGKEEEGVKYKDYFEWQESVADVPSHRILAMKRGEKEEILSLDISPDPNEAIQILEDIFVTSDKEDSQQVKMSIADCYKRLLSRSMETEIRVSLKERADTEAIRIFGDNLRHLLLASPLGSKRVMGIDPGYRTGCKVVCIDPQGKLLHNETIYPHTSDFKSKEAAESINKLCKDFAIEAIAIGNGTAGRESETFIKKVCKNKNIKIIMVNESGASVYSASEIAREEFPDHDVTVRGSVSIARRLMDPLAELVKIDPKSIGVGQYQHDVDQTALKQSLDDVVISCVNLVGVDLNTASAQLLSYISGLGNSLAKNIVTFRNKNGAFMSRQKLLDVPRLGPKAFEQAAGFLKIRNGENPLDGSAVHPESYHIVSKMAKDLGCEIKELMDDKNLIKKINISKYVTETVGLPTLKDIIDELAKPGRDPREEFEEFSFAQGVEKIEDLITGMKLPGIVTNVAAFGVFVDIGVHQDGLIHISELSDQYVKDPAEIVKVGQKVNVSVIAVDTARNRISLSMKSVKGDETKSKPEKKQDAASHKGQKKKQGNQPFNNPFANFFDNKRL